MMNIHFDDIQLQHNQYLYSHSKMLNLFVNMVLHVYMD
uniref:Uncharacterized protein n=1 Tax=Schistosoma curassoni TaxID=6186 RepID=A0A183JJP1_9TREM